MKNIFLIVSVCFMSFQLNAQSANVTEPLPNGPCKTDKDCVLFNDECGVLLSVPNDKLPAGSKSLKKKEISYFAYDPKALPECTRHFFVKPEWPANPVAKCVKEECTIESKPVTLKKRTKRPSSAQ